MDRRPRRSVILLASLTLLAGLGASRLTYHEAIWAQTAREMIASGDWLVPTLDGRPWLEKPPLETWLTAASGWLCGGVSEVAARLPSALAAMALCLVVTSFAARRFGPTTSLLAGLIQATTSWTVVRGRLAEADIALAVLVAGALAAMDRVRSGEKASRRSFWLLVGATALAKGIGFGAILVVATTMVTLLWDRDTKAFRALAYPVGLVVALLIALIWPLAVLRRHPEALSLWTMHVSDRLSSHPSHFAGERWGEYLLSPIAMTLPWTPLAAFGAWSSARRAIRERVGPDRLLWAWAIVPAALVSCASVRNGHYLIYALPPASIWAATGLIRVSEWLKVRRGWSAFRMRRESVALFAAVGLCWAIGFVAIGPKLNPRDAEFAFYERVRGLVPPDEPVVLIYDLRREARWDKEPYPTPFGPVPADLAARLYYLRKPASWRMAAEDVMDNPPPPPTFAAIGRERDAAILRRLGQVEVLDRGPTTRWDRAFVLYRVTGSSVGSAIADLPGANGPQ